MTTHPPQTSDGEFGYYCPIHPELLKDKPGICPLCGMVLCETSSDEE